MVGMAYPVGIAGVLGGQLVAPVTQTKPPFWVWNAGLNQLYLSSYHLSAGNLFQLSSDVEGAKSCLSLGL